MRSGSSSRRFSASWRWIWYTMTGFISLEKIHCGKEIAVFFLLCSYIEAEVSPLMLASFLTLVLLFDEFLKLSMMVTPISLLTKLPITCFQLIYKFLYGDKFDFSYSIWLTQWKYSGLFFEEHGVWLWLWGRRLVINIGCLYRDDLLCGCLAANFSHNSVFFYWCRFRHWLPFLFRCRRFFNWNICWYPLLSKG